MMPTVWDKGLNARLVIFTRFHGEKTAEMFKNTLRGFPKARTKLELAKIVVASCKFQIAESNDDSLKWK